LNVKAEWLMFLVYPPSSPPPPPPPYPPPPPFIPILSLVFPLVDLYNFSILLHIMFPSHFGSSHS